MENAPHTKIVVVAKEPSDTQEQKKRYTNRKLPVLPLSSGASNRLRPRTMAVKDEKVLTCTHRSDHPVRTHQVTALEVFDKYFGRGMEATLQTTLDILEDRLAFRA